MVLRDGWALEREVHGHRGLAVARQQGMRLAHLRGSQHGDGEHVAVGQVADAHEDRASVLAGPGDQVEVVAGDLGEASPSAIASSATIIGLPVALSSPPEPAWPRTPR